MDIRGVKAIEPFPITMKRLIEGFFRFVRSERLQLFPLGRIWIMIKPLYMLSQ